MPDIASTRDTIIAALVAIDGRLKENPPDSEKSSLMAAQEQLVQGLSRAALQEFSAAAGNVAQAAHDLENVGEGSSTKQILEILGREVSAADPVPVGHRPDMAVSASTSPSIISRIVDTAIQQWQFFGGQEYNSNGTAIVVGHKEGEDNYAERIGEYWTYGANTKGLDGRDHGWPWSAAFISWVMRTAGAEEQFRYSTQHSVYISQSIRDRLKSNPAGFWAWRLEEYRPQIGDLVCWTRETGVDYDHQKNGNYAGHADIVVAAEAARIWVVGGNVGDSVTKRPLSLTDNGFLATQNQGGETLIAIMQNRLALNDLHPSQASVVEAKLLSSQQTLARQADAESAALQDNSMAGPSEEAAKSSVLTTGFGVVGAISPIFNDAGYELIKKFEGCVLYAYDDATAPPHRVDTGDQVRGTITIGYGHTGSDVMPGLTWTQSQAEQALKSDLQQFISELRPLIKRQLSDNQFSAFVCLAFNIGTANFKTSSALDAANVGNLSAVPALMALWHKTRVDGILVDSVGLKNRRAAEGVLWNQS